jgi:galactose-1-phosphate uridylyltransferase
MYEGLIFLAMMLFAALTARLAAEVCSLEEIITDERREKYRQIAYAAMHKERTVKQNREKLWEETVNVR